MIGNVTVEVTRPGGLDDNGDEIEPTDDPHTLEACSIAPRISTETTDRAREGAVIGLPLYCPPGTDIANGDEVTVTAGPHAGTYRVDGIPGRWESGLTSWEAGTVAELRAANG